MYGMTCVIGVTKTNKGDIKEQIENPKCNSPNTVYNWIVNSISLGEKRAPNGS